MSILEKEILVSISNKNVNHYEDLGYEITKNNNKYEKILVRVEDLLEGSGTKLTKVCDMCGKHVPNQTYQSIILSRKNNGSNCDVCKSCKTIRYWESKKENIKYESSLEYYAKMNNKEYLLEEFSDKNIKTPKEITFGTNDEYLWNCLKCGNEYKKRVLSRTYHTNENCPNCIRKVDDTNCLWATHPEVAKLLVDKDVGYRVSHGMSKKEEFSCGSCGYTAFKQIVNVVKKGLGCTKCSDGISYSEKFIAELLNQLEIQYDKEKVFEWSKKENKKYDFYIPSLNCIIETHGIQHYGRGFQQMGSRSLETEKENDKLKEELARENGIEKYIIINCSKSELEYIKINITSSELTEIFDLTSIDWLKCHEYACKSLVKEACSLWNSGIKSAVEIGKILKLHGATITRYLKQGKTLGLCDYSVYKASVVVQLSLDGEFIKEWKSAHKVYKELNITQTSIGNVCKGKRISAGGYVWMYEEDYEKTKGEITPIFSKGSNRKVVQLTLEGVFVREWDSITEASVNFSIDKNGITKVCRGKNKTAAGFKWMYKEDYDNILS